MNATLHPAIDWAARHRALLAALLAVMVLLVLVVPIVRPPRPWPSPDPPVAVAPPAPSANSLSLAVALERLMVGPRGLDDSRPASLDAGRLEQRLADGAGYEPWLIKRRPPVPGPGSS